jgi:cytochrome b subunit of formate dehydrogenase
VPERAQRHSLAARLFHWVMAAAVLTLAATAFLPHFGARFAWVQWHWTAGLVLLLALGFHLVHALFFQDPWAMLPGRKSLGRARPGKYPLANQLFHLAAGTCVLCAAATGVLLLFRVRTPVLPRDPYVLGDAAWGLVYVLHGLAGVGLLGLIVLHVYFALRPEKLPITKAMVLGSMERDYILAHHDPREWGCEPSAAQEGRP